jgi:hypothetical protein
MRRSPVVGRKFFCDGRFLSDLYHPRAVFREPEFLPAIRRSGRVEMLPALYSVGGRPCTVPGAWLDRDLFSGIFDWLSAGLPGGVAAARHRRQPIGTFRRRILAPDDWAQKIDCTAAINIGIGRKRASSLAKRVGNDQD